MKKILFLTTIIEAITLFFRFGLGLKSTESTASTIGKLTFGIRIHHGYIGLLLLIATFTFKLKNKFKDQLPIIGWALFLSDAVHHLILYVVTGSADFDLVY